MYDSDHDWTKSSDCERWMYMSLSCNACVKEIFLTTNYKMVPPSCQKHSRTRHAACNCTPAYYDNGGPMEPMSSHKPESLCAKCLSIVTVVPLTTTFQHDRPVVFWQNSHTRQWHCTLDEGHVILILRHELCCVSNAAPFHERTMKR